MRAAAFLTICISGANFSAPVQVLGQDIASVQGRVLSKSSAVPLRGIELYLVPTTDSTAPKSTESRDDGSFAFESVGAGRYLVLEEGEMTSYLRLHEQSGLDVPERAVEVRAGQTSPQVSIYVNAGGILQGRVTGPDHAPIAGLQVMTLRTVTIDGLERMLPAGSGITAQDGTYQIIRLRAGTYSVAAAVKRKTEDGIELESNVQAGGGKSLVRTFYPGAPDAKSARPVTVVDDQVVPDVNIQMQRGSVYSIGGEVVNAAEGHGYKIYVQQELDVSSLRMIRVAEDRSFSIGGLSPGLYSLELLDTTPGVRRGPAVLAHAEVEIKAENVQDVRLAIKAPSSVVVRAIVHGLADDAEMRLFLRPTINPTAPIVFSDRDSNGMYLFRAPSPEPNVLTITGLPPGMAVQSITFNGKPVSSAVIDLTNGGGQIDITIGPSGKQ